MSLHLPASSAERPSLTAKDVEGLVGPGRVFSRVDVLDVTPSTNSALVRALSTDPTAWPHFSAIVADYQSQGRGRAGRTWTTPPRSALTMSVVIRPKVEPKDRVLAPLVAGLAVSHALRALGVGAMIKWPNDIVVADGVKEIEGWGLWRKCVGILCESVGDAIVIGIGVNVSQTAAELPVPHATSLALLGATSTDRSTVLKEVAVHLLDAVGSWETGVSVREFAVQICATIGANVDAHTPGGKTLSGKAVDINHDGSLVIEDALGKRHTVNAGDVQLRWA